MPVEHRRRQMHSPIRWPTAALKFRVNGAIAPTNAAVLVCYTAPEMENRMSHIATVVVFTLAEAIVAALSELRPDFVLRFYPDKLKESRKLSPADETGYLVFLDTRAALSRLESKLHEGFMATNETWRDGQPIEGRWVKELSPADAEAIIEKHKPRGASLCEALVTRLFLEIDAGDFWRIVPAAALRARHRNASPQTAVARLAADQAQRPPPSGYSEGAFAPGRFAADCRMDGSRTRNRQVPSLML